MKTKKKKLEYVGIITHSDRHILLLLQYAAHSTGEMRN